MTRPVDPRDPRMPPPLSYPTGQWTPPGSAGPYPGYLPPPPPPPKQSRVVMIFFGAIIGLIGFVPLGWTVNPFIHKPVGGSYTGELIIIFAVQAVLASLLFIESKTRYLGVGVILGGALCCRWLAAAGPALDFSG